MNSKLNIYLNTILSLALGLILVSCQDTIPTRTAIGHNIGGSDDETPAPVTRPTGAVKFKSDYCSCKDNKPISYGNCASFCADKSTNGAEILYANFTTTEAISLTSLANVHGWCTKLMEGDQTNPKCLLEAKKEDGSVAEVDVTVAANSNSLTAKIQDVLDYNKTYILTLVETTSGARSDSIQFVKFSSDVGIPVLGPLKNAPISQYTCMVRKYSTAADGSIYYDQAYRLHFYYLPSIPPTPIPAGTSFLICHDVFNPLYGATDSELYPRFENIPGIFNLWDTTDPRFYNNNGTGSEQDVNDIIVQKTKDFGGSIPASTSFFNQFTWPGSPTISEEAGNDTTTTQPIGYFMAPWIDQSTYKSYCLNSTHYNSSNALFKAMRDVIEVDTEGLYVGEKAAETITSGTGTTSTGEKDYILIRETDLKAVWFYLNNGVPTAPTDTNVGSVAVYFYYPLNKTSPFVKTSTQRIYRVKGANELNNVSTNTNTSAGSTSYPPHDRKIGCIPKF